MHISYEVKERRNGRCKNGTEWALNMTVTQGDNSTIWTISTWEGKKAPKEEEVQKAVRISKRSMSILISNIKIEKLTFE